MTSQKYQIPHREWLSPLLQPAWSEHLHLFQESCEEMPSHKTVVWLKDDGILQKAATTTLGGRELALAGREQQPSWLQRMFFPGPLLLLWLSGPQLILPLPQSQVLPLPWALGLLVAEVPRLSKILICRTQGLCEEPSIPRITYMRAVRTIVKGKQWKDA